MLESMACFVALYVFFEYTHISYMASAFAAKKCAVSP